MCDVGAYGCMCIHVHLPAVSPAYLQTSVHSLSTSVCVCMRASHSPSCHLCWCDDALRPIKPTGGTDPAHNLYGVN